MPSDDRRVADLVCAPGALFWIDVRAPALNRLGSDGGRTQWRFQADIGRVRAKLLHPFAKNVLVDVDVPRRLSHAYVSLTHQADRLDLHETGRRPTNGIAA